MLTNYIYSFKQAAQSVLKMLFQTNSKIRAQKFVSELKRLRVCGAQVSVLDRWPAHTDCQEHTEFIQFHLLVKRQYFNRSAAQK